MKQRKIPNIWTVIAMEKAFIDWKGFVLQMVLPMLTAKCLL